MLWNLDQISQKFTWKGGFSEEANFYVYLCLQSISNVLAAVPLFSNQQDVDVKDVVYKARVSLDNVLNVRTHPLFFFNKVVNWSN